MSAWLISGLGNDYKTGRKFCANGLPLAGHRYYSERIILSRFFSFVYFSSACTYTPRADQVSWFRSDGTHTHSGDRDGEERRRRQWQRRRRRRWENYWPTKASRGARVCMAITAAGASIALTQRHSTTREPARAGREVTTDRASTLCTRAHTHTHTHTHIHTLTMPTIHTLYRVFPRRGAPFKKTWSMIYLRYSCCYIHQVYGGRCYEFGKLLKTRFSFLTNSAVIIAKRQNITAIVVIHYSLYYYVHALIQNIRPR